MPLFTLRRGMRAFLAYDAIPIGGIAVSVMLGTYALLNVLPSVPLLVLAFCGTTFVYRVDRGAGVSPEDRYNRPCQRIWQRRHCRYVAGSTLLCIAVGGVMLFLLRSSTVFAAAGLGVLGLLHALPVLGSGRRLKSFGRVKPFAVSGAWALGGVLLPVIEAGRGLTVGVLVLAGYRFAVVLANTLLADWSDREGDARAGLHTVATEWSSTALFRAVRSLLGVTFAGGLAVAAVYRLPLLFIDLAGLVGMLGLVRRLKVCPTRRARLAVDLIVAWPLVTALAWWFIERG